MKKVFLLFLFFASIFGCTKDNRNQFIGTWNNFPNHLDNEIQFYKDSVVIWDPYQKTSATWTVNKSKIKFKNLKYELDPEAREWNLNYKFNQAKDSLFLSHENDSTEILMMKINDKWKHYLKYYNLQLEIPEAGPLMSLIQKKSTSYPNIFIGWKDGKITVKGDTADKKKSYIYDIMDHQYPLTVNKDHHPISLIVDKNIPEKSLDSIKKIIRTLNFKNIHFFQVFTHKYIETNYGYIDPDCIRKESWYWYGMWED